MKTIKYDLNNKKVQYLIKSNKELGTLIKYIKSCSILIEEDGFRCITKYIIGQQISDKTRETIWIRLCNKYKEITPEVIKRAKENDLRNIGICTPKINYIKNVADAILNNNINLDSFKDKTNDEIIKELTKIKGIGSWTVEMYLIFSLGRENVLSLGDNTIKRVIKWLYNLDEMPSKNDLLNYFEKWKQYATIVSAFFWEAIAKNVLSISIDELKERKF